MDHGSLVQQLREARAYEGQTGPVEVCSTHISVVFLIGDRAYKLKKPVTLEFLDFSTRERRRHFCEEEVRLNRRYAPGVYLGVVPVVEGDDGVVVDGEGEPLDHLVVMRRLDDDGTLRAHLEREAVPLEVFDRLGRHLARLHADAERGEAIAVGGRHAVVARNALDNFHETERDVGTSVRRVVHGRLRALTERALDELRTLIEGRVERGVPCDTHGDLRLEHVYLQEPDRFLILDCIEFNERFRYADPVADLAFLYMDLACRGYRRRAERLAEAWFGASGDGEGRRLLRFYAAYRSVVRAKVAGLKLGDLEGEARDAMLQRAEMHWLYALSALEDPEHRPCVVGIGGLPGTGKSTLARGLAEAAGMTVIRTDVVRQELVDAEGTGAWGEGRYSEQARQRVYDACWERAAAALRDGRRVIVDASLSRDRWRAELLGTADRMGVRGLWLECRADPGVVRARLEARHDDASEADWSIHQQAREHWESPGERAARDHHVVDTGGEREDSLRDALQILRELDLVAP